MIQTERRVADHRQKLDSGELTARQLAELYLGRIEAVDKDGPHLNSIIELNPEALRRHPFVKGTAQPFVLR